MSSTTDPADAAGGEVVYSSDGLDPIPASKPPSLVAPLASPTEESILDSDDISPQTAFELFQGKIYSTKTASQSMAAFRANETPLETLARLTSEVEALEAQLKVTATPESGRDFDEELVRLASSLKSRLETVKTTQSKEQDDLTRLIRRQLQGMQSSQEASTSSPAKSSTVPATGVVYELYGNASNPTTTLEERILTLERLLGDNAPDAAASHKPKTGRASLLGRLQDLEALIQAIDATQLEATATKAKVIRADLEAASKARNKLAATYKKEDSKMIQSLHSQMVELEGLSSYLPQLVERLQQLSQVHVQSSGFAQRLVALEASAQQMSGHVAQMETTFGSLQSNMVANLQTMEGNLAQLDERLKK